ncbi:hypothetical protein ACFFRR_010942 [Megaselia abdita]
MFFRELFVYLVIIFTFYSIIVQAGRYDGCSIGLDKESFLLNELENNSPKNNEVVRSKGYFISTPCFLITQENGNEIYFGIYRNEAIFAIYENFKDYTHGMNPKYFTTNITDFDGKNFMEVDIILKKNGHFSVIVYGKSDAFISWKSGLIFDKLLPFNIILSSNNNKFLYDCPICT